jgi:hypothetical protein
MLQERKESGFEVIGEFLGKGLFSKILWVSEKIYDSFDENLFICWLDLSIWMDWAEW